MQSAPEEKGGLNLGQFLSFGKEESGAPEKPKRGRPPKKQPVKLDPDELARFLLIPVLLAVCKRYIQRLEARPTEEEAEGFTIPLARIIVRHMPAVSASEDLIDLGRMMLAGMSWYMRIAALAEDEKKPEPQAESEEAPHAPEKSNGREPFELVVPAPARVGLFVGSG